MGRRVKCQGCGRMLVPLRDGTARYHNGSYRPHSPCRSSGYRLDRWPVGQRLRHRSGDLWIIEEDRGGQWGDYLLRCIAGREKDRVMVGHGEYMHRHGWTPDARGHFSTPRAATVSDAERSQSSDRAGGSDR